MRIIIHLKKMRGQLFPVHKPQLEKRLDDDRRPIALFFFVILFYVCYQLIMQPDWVTGGEMWAEMATNYYSNANASSYIQKLLSTDAGYIPAPQRLIALMGNQLNLPAASIPYFYTWSSILLTGMLVGAFCLAPFRILVNNDFLRLFISVAILLVADFESRTFVNFTYFSAFFVSIITALALASDSEEMPWWAWLVPVFMVSKPAVLAALPAMILVAFVSGVRFRLIVLITVILCAGQLLQMFISSAAGVMPIRATDISFVSKQLAIVKYFLGLMGCYLTGPAFKLQEHHQILAGSFVLSLCAYLLVFRRSASNALILVGVSLLFFNVSLNVFALTDSWNLDMARLQGNPIYRHIIVGFFGCILVLCGVISSALNKSSVTSCSPFVGGATAFLFFIWFLGSGWLEFAGKISREPVFPTVNSSQWQIMADAIDDGLSPLCVPIDPWSKGANWMFNRNCGLLKPPPAWEDGSVVVNNNLAYQVGIPEVLLDKNLVAAAVFVKPLGHSRSFVGALMRVKLKDSSTRYFSGSNDFNASGGLLMLLGEKPVAMGDVESITLMFNAPVEVAQEPAGIPGVAWMGY
ncbi:hypothetical protein J8E27_09220 [Brucella sp. 458]|uniref:hypothetical protein n=1 Tax=Brucella sp. 458 TaxID=2821140 RepID=UPI001ADFDAFD|nr:hypothetical protein [Brucella sp. 458]QTN98420.1 hypothetical protein J8E27_09220 [Brucella sp. 458]